MNRVAIIYKSKYGSTREYAQWIANELKGDLIEGSEIKVKDLFTYDTIIFGGGIYASGINGISLITKSFQVLKNKNLIIFTVGLASTNDKEVFKPIIQKKCTEGMQRKIQIFHLRGGIDYKSLSFMHKAMMWMLKTTVSRKKAEELSEDDQMMLATYGDEVDFTDIKTIEPLIKHVENIKR